MAPRTMSTLYSWPQVGLLELLLFPSLLPNALPPFLILLLTLLTVSFRVAKNSRRSHTMQIILGHTPFPLHQCCLPYPTDSSSRSGKASFHSKPSLEFDLEFFTLNYSILSWSLVSMKEVIDQGSCKASFRVLDYLSGQKDLLWEKKPFITWTWTAPDIKWASHCRMSSSVGTKHKRNKLWAC